VVDEGEAGDGMEDSGKGIKEKSMGSENRH
jgi:hypothetical protein